MSHILKQNKKIYNNKRQGTCDCKAQTQNPKQSNNKVEIVNPETYPQANATFLTINPKVPEKPSPKPQTL